MVRPGLILVLVQAWIGCSSGGSSDRLADRAMIDKLRADYSAAYSAGEAERTAAMYDPDGVLMPQNLPLLSGRPAILEYLQDSFEHYIIKLTLTSTEVVFVADDWAFDRGTYLISQQSRVSANPREGANAAEDGGNYLVLWHRQDGAWKLARDIDNSARPAGGVATMR